MVNDFTVATEEFPGESEFSTICREFRNGVKVNRLRHYLFYALPMWMVLAINRASHMTPLYSLARVLWAVLGRPGEYDIVADRFQLPNDNDDHTHSPHHVGHLDDMSCIRCGRPFTDPVCEPGALQPGQ